MKILVINGRPKGGNSITLWHIQYITKENSWHGVDIMPVFNRIRQIEKTNSCLRKSWTK